MKTVIYYFTGTGNSLAAAREIGALLGDTDLVPVAALMKAGGEIVPAADRVGIVCPVYFAGLPAMVAAFAERLDLAGKKYVFSVVTFGGSGDSSALRQLDGILKRRSGRGLDAGFGVKMPGNYLLLYEPPAGEKRKKILAAAQEQVAGIARDIRQGLKRDLPYSVLLQALHALMYPRFASRVHGDDRNFTVSDACTSCGICAAVCPAQNIGLVDGRPVWNHRCELCCACIHLCPAEAIQAGRRTANRQRYRHPDVKVEDMEVQRGITDRRRRIPAGGDGDE